MKARQDRLDSLVQVPTLKEMKALKAMRCPTVTNVWDPTIPESILWGGLPTLRRSHP